MSKLFKKESLQFSPRNVLFLQPVMCGWVTKDSANFFMQLIIEKNSSNTLKCGKTGQIGSELSGPFASL